MQPNSPAARIYAAIDTTDLDRARALTHALAGVVGGVKVGKEFFTAHGPEGIRAILDAPETRHLGLFLDLKFHDIPNTVAGAIRAAAPLAPSWLTVHASGGPAMLRAAADAAAETRCDDGRPRTRVLAVTVLTSLDDEDLEAVGQRSPVSTQVERLATLAQDNGIDGLVCSPREIALLRNRLGPDMALVVPGIRPTWSVAGDQKRVTTPRDALAAGADVLVIGRPITQAESPAAAARQIVDEIAA
ncbi:orotidine-5'-phosphate decarboxylase [Rhodovibrio salinarum]|uniref:Orotidine 5'-phosphate decarboxylase n=1 Tax=Rhodovibrio salinarum TaxID=1087 RepID=A0A934QHQ5_9PROT|nr:orotidine-5'-phosphate decarboxylase [Rhodovibrio salinarum]MBK1697238.1 orotidine-5'-phosphate decarboxylase [Rhodovibrio salinarum]